MFVFSENKIQNTKYDHKSAKRKPNGRQKQHKRTGNKYRQHIHCSCAVISVNIRKCTPYVINKVQTEDHQEKENAKIDFFSIEKNNNNRASGKKEKEGCKR